MQDLCNLANTGSNIALYVVAAFGILALASLLLYQLKTGKTFSKGFFALLLVFGIVGTLLLSPAATHAGGVADCPQASSNGSQASITCPENWVVVPGNSYYHTSDFCLMKYTAKRVGATEAPKFNFVLYTGGNYSTNGTWSIVIAGPINATVGPFPYDVDGSTVAAALQTAVGETVTTDNTGRIENNNSSEFSWASLTDSWNISLDLSDLEQNDGPGLNDMEIVDDGTTVTGGTAASQASSTPWVNISQTDAITASQTAGSGAHLLTENEWMTIAHNVLANPANWCNADGSGCGNAPGTSGKVLASGHNDGSPNQALEASADDSQACFGTVTAGVNTPCGSEAGTQKRTLTLSNGAVIWDLVGNVAHWTTGTETRGNLPSNSGSGGGFEYNLDSGFSLPTPDNWGTLAYANPAVYNPAAANWGAAQGVGFLYSDFASGSSAVVAFVRGGAWVAGPASGAFTLALGGTPSDSDSGVGFRAAL